MYELVGCRRARCVRSFSVVPATRERSTARQADVND
jgi:hypothetical protein